MIKHAKCEHIDIRFPSTMKLETLQVVCFIDASFGNVKNGGSQGGCIIFVTDNSGVCALLSWSSKRLRRVVKSTLAAENLALIYRLDTAIFVRQLLTELLYQRIDYRIPILCFINNNDVSVELKSKNDVTEKRLRLEIHLIRENIEKENVRVLYIHKESTRRYID